MALRLATVQKPPKKRIASTPPPKQEHTTKPDYAEELDVEKKYDPNSGEIVVVAPKERKKYPSCDATTRVAKCVYCEKMKDKAEMMCLGQNHHEKGSLRYVWRCAAKMDANGRITKEGCEAGSKSWLKNYAHKSPFGKLWNYNLDTGKVIRHGEESEKAVGKQIVEKVQSRIDSALSKALSKHKSYSTNETIVPRKKLISGNERAKVLELLNSLKKGAKKQGGKNVTVELKAKLGRRTVVVARAEEKRNEPVGEQLRRAATVDQSSTPRWKRKGRSAKLRR
jgi:hypothetical protein